MKSIRVSILSEKKIRVTLFIVSIFAVQAMAGTWLAGDLHTHSTYSDDADAKVQEMINEAKKRKLNFLAITDHDNHFCDTDSTTVPVWSDPDFVSTDELLLLYGAEWTSAKGHANIFSATPYKYGNIWNANRNNDPVRAQDAIKVQGGIFSINHPLNVDPWEVNVPDGLVCMEVWNSNVFLFDQNNFRYVYEFWDNNLLSGKRIACIGGSDTHSIQGIKALVAKMGGPTTWVYVDEKSQKGIIDAICKGHSTVSYSASDIRATLLADADNNGNFEIMVGDNINVPVSKTIQFSVNLDNTGTGGEKTELANDLLVPVNTNLIGKKFTEAFNEIGKLCETGKYIVTIVKNGQLFKAWKTSNVNQWSLPVLLESQKKEYYRVEVYGKMSSGRVFRVAVSSPIYCNFEPNDQLYTKKSTHRSRGGYPALQIRNNGGLLTISALQEEIRKVRVVDIEGRECKVHKSSQMLDNTFVVNNLPDGIYYIHVKTITGSFTYPVTIVNSKKSNYWVTTHRSVN